MNSLDINLLDQSKQEMWESGKQNNYHSALCELN
jgi:hypothetical protein